MVYYMAFLALEKNTGSAFQYTFARERDHSRPRSLNKEIPGRAIETRRDSKNSFFKNEVIFAFITLKVTSKVRLTIFLVMPGHDKKIMPAQQPISVRVLL